MFPDHRFTSAGALGLAITVVLTATALAQETYISQEVLQAPWGSDPGQFGLIEEAEGVGPQSLCLDSGGNIYVLDLVNRRVQVFTPWGGFLRQMAFEMLAHDLCLNQEGELFLLAPYHGMVEKFDSEGHFMARWPISPQIQLIDGIGIVAGQVVLHTTRQTEHALTGPKGPLSLAEQLEQVQLGMGGPDPQRRYRTKWINNHLGLLQFLDARGQKLREVQVTTSDVLGSLIFLGADGAGSVYLRAETFRPQGEVIQRVFKYNSHGTKLAEFQVPVDGFTYLYRNLRVHENGDLYQLLTDPEGVRVLRWRSVSEVREGQ